MRTARPTRLPPAGVVLPLGIGTAFSLLGDSSMYTVLPLRAAEIGVPLASVGILLGVNRLVRIVFNGVAGHLYDRLRKRRLFLLSLLVGALSTFLYSVSRGFVPLVAARVLWGLAWSGIAIGSADIIISAVRREERGKWMGIYEMWFLAGSAAGSLLGGVLTDVLGYRWAMGINAGAAGLSILVVFAMLPDVGGATAMHAARIRIRLQRWSAGVYLAAVVQGLCRLVLVGILSSLLSLLVREKLAAYLVAVGASTLTGGVNILRTATGAASATGLGWVSDRLKDRWLVVATGLAFGTAGLVLVARGAPVLFALGLFACSIPAGSIPVLTRILVGELAGNERVAGAVSLLQTAGDIGSAAGPPLAFLLVERMDFSTIFFVAAGTFGAATLAVLALRGLVYRAAQAPQQTSPSGE